jgi:hypothetical protein
LSLDGARLWAELRPGRGVKRSGTDAVADARASLRGVGSGLLSTFYVHLLRDGRIRLGERFAAFCREAKDRPDAESAMVL